MHTADFWMGHLHSFASAKLEWMVWGELLGSGSEVGCVGREQSLVGQPGFYSGEVFS